MKRMITRRWIVVTCWVVMLMLSNSSRLCAKTFKMTMGVGIPAGLLPFTKEIKDFWAPEIEKRVAARTSHQIAWTLHFSASVVKLPDQFEAVQDGLIDVSMVFPIFENPALFIPNFAFFAPFGLPDEELATQVNLKVYEKNPWLTEVFEKKYNQKFLATATYERYDLVTTFPVKSMADLAGRKIAAAGPNLPWIKTIGCVPVQSIVTDAYTSLQTGVYEGWVLPISAVWGFKLNEVAPHMTMVGFGAISGPVLTMNLNTWNSLPPEVQKIFLEIGPEYAMRVAKETKAKNSLAIEDMQKKGKTTFFRLPESDMQNCMAKLGQLANEKAKEADQFGQPGSQIMRDYIEETEKAGHKWPLRWEIK